MYNYNNSSIIYVSQSVGDDACHNGLTPVADSHGNGPFKTIKRALGVIGQSRVAGKKTPMTISFIDDYYLEDTVSVGIDKSLSLNILPSCGVTFESYGTRKKIVGGIKITEWERDTFNGVECISATLPQKNDGTRWDFTDLFVNGKRANNTRYPSSGTLEAKRTENDFKSETGIPINIPSKWVLVNASDLEDVENIENATVNFNHYWVDEHTPVESYDKTTGKLTFKYPSRFTITTNYGDSCHASAFKYYLENVPTMFKNKNEWYLDRETGKVYYIPEEQEIDVNNICAYAPTLNKLFEFYGEDNNKLYDIKIDNLELMCTRGDYVSRYVKNPITGQYEETDDEAIGFGADNQSACYAHGAVSFKNANRCQITNCLIHHTGTYAIEIKTGCNNVKVENNEFNDLGGGAIKIFGGMAGCNESELTGNCVMRNNKITDCGKRLAASCGILVCHASNNEITDNEISNIQYSGISVGWVWGYADSSTYGNIISKNYIHNIGVGELSDLAAIYLLGKQQGTVVSYNRIHNVSCAHYGGYGIYTDEGSSYIVIENNVVYNTKSPAYYHHYGVNNVVRNNIFALSRFGAMVARSEVNVGVLFENNIFVVDNTPVYGTWNNRFAMATKNNLFWDLSNKQPMMYVEREEEYPFDKWQQIQNSGEGDIVADPEFLDIRNYDFTLSANSPAIKLGFKPITGFTATGKYK